jgi:predicted acyl esterase
VSSAARDDRVVVTLSDEQLDELAERVADRLARRRARATRAEPTSASAPPAAPALDEVTRARARRALRRLGL